MSQSTFIFFKEKDTGSLAHVLQIIDAYLEEYQKPKEVGISVTLPATLPYTALALKVQTSTCSRILKRMNPNYR